MRRINLETEAISLSELLSLARDEPVMLLSPNGEEFILKHFLDEDAEFAAEVEALRGSKSFQAFLDERLNYKKTTPIEEILMKVEREISAGEG